MRTPVVALAAVAVLVGFGTAHAGSVVYSESITTDGVLGGTPFTSALVTLTFTADSSNVTFFQGTNFTQYTNIPSVATVSVAGVGSATFTDPFSLSVSVFPTFSEFAATDTATSTDILDIFATPAGFAGYNMQTSFGPVSGGAAYPVGTPFGTSVGDFDITKTGGGIAAFDAVAPEPSSFLLLAIGLIGTFVLGRSVKVRASTVPR